MTADECPFCATSVVATRTSRRTIKPRSILPFKVTREEATAAWRRWLHRLWFAPTAIRRLASTERRLHGMYVPYWTFDCGALSVYSGERGDDYWDTQIVMVRQGKSVVPQTRRVRKTRWRPVSGRVWNTFDDVLVLASRSLPPRHTQQLEPWDLQALVAYRDEFLSGFEAESYQIDLPQGFEAAKLIMDEEIRRSICRDIGGDHQRIHDVKTRHDNVKFKHILLPVWISAYRWKSKLYRFVVNARTGEVQGERPFSVWKIVLTIAGILAVAGVAALIAHAS